MGLDRRLRDELHQQADQVATDSVQALESVTRRAEEGRRVPARLGIAAAAVAVAALLIRLVAVGPALPVTPGASPAPVRPSETPASGDRAPLVGSWTVSLVAGDPGVDALGMAGPWTIHLGPTSRLDLVPPSGYTTPGGGPLAGYSYALTGESFLSNLFARDFAESCTGSGTYTWQLDGDRLTFAGTDTCGPRQTLLVTRPWVRAVEPTASSAP